MQGKQGSFHLHLHTLSLPSASPKIQLVVGTVASRQSERVCLNTRGGWVPGRLMHFRYRIAHHS